METEYKIRPLKRKDRRIVSAMIVKMADKIGNTGLANIISSAGSDKTETDSGKQTERMINMGVELIKMLFSTLEDDIAAWFADLIGKSKEEFDDLPVDIELQIIDQLRTAPEVGLFFSGALRQFSEMKKYGTMLQSAKGR